MFKIETIDSNGESCGFVLLAQEKTPALFKTGKEAAEHVLSLKAREGAEGINFRIIRDDSAGVAESLDSWKARERLRLEYMIYSAVPWANESWFKDSPYADSHFPHISTENPGKIAFTESAEKGLADKQKQIRAGRYLSRFFSESISADTIRKWASEVSLLTGDSGIEIAMTPDEIVRVYSVGPRSCMANKEYVRVYGAGDLGVAYLVNPDSPDSISCRAIVWPEKKIYGRVYGDGGEYSAAFTNGLHAMGFQHYHSAESGFNNARLLRIPDGDGFVCPYLDIHDSVSDDGEYLRIGGDEYHAQTESGVCGDSGELCIHCEERFNEDYGTYLDGVGAYCESCADNQLSWCEDCQETIRVDDAHHIENLNKTVCNCCVDSYPVCDSCHEHHDSDSISCTNSGEAICDSCAEDSHFWCCQCSELCPNYERHESDSIFSYCESCGEEAAEEAAEQEAAEQEAAEQEAFNRKPRFIRWLIIRRIHLAVYLDSMLVS